MYYFLFWTGMVSICFAGSYKTIKTPKAPRLSVIEKNGQLSLKSIPEKNVAHKDAVSYAFKKIIIPRNTKKIRFKVRSTIKNNRKGFLGSIFLGENKYLLNAHEAGFWIESTSWNEITIPLHQFVRNQKPWNVKRMDGTKTSVDTVKVTHLGFGRGFQNHHYNIPNYAFDIKDIEFIEEDQQQKLKITKGIAKSCSKIKNGKHLKVLLLGDSITYLGKGKSHFYHALKQIEIPDSKFDVANMAISGHSVRGGSIVLARSLAAMPDPDLVIIMYGANDCKSVSLNSGFSSVVFESQLEHFLHHINRLTKGKSEFILLNGVPRINIKSKKSEGSVEKLSPAYENLSKKYSLPLCDTMSAYLEMSPESKAKYYRDSVHQNQRGLEFIGKHIAKTLLKNLR